MSPRSIVRESERAYASAFARGIKPEPRITVSEWADRNRMLSRRSSKEIGLWRTDRFPFLREIMDCLSTTSPVQTVVFVKGSQVGGTEAGNNWIGYVIDHAPGPMMAVLPTGGTGQRKTRQSIDPLIEDTPSVASKVAARKSRDPGNTATLKLFPGGMLVIASAGSAAELRSMPIRFLFLDEIDAYVDIDEGDPEDLAERGTRTYRETRKVYKVSTPTIEGRSRIMFAFRNTDRRYYEVPCPYCNAFQRITWPKIRWDMGQDEDRLDVAAQIENEQREVWLECERCAKRIDEVQKSTMLPAGRWVPEEPRLGDLVRGYHLSALYSPWGFYSWGQSVARHLKAHASGNPAKLRVWINQDLGETFKERGDAPPWRALFDRRERYPMGVVPVGGRILTAGCDVQQDRLELEVVAWGPDWESWSVDYVVIPGDFQTDQEVRTALERLLARTWEHADGGPDLPISAFGIDTSFASSTVQAWLRQFGRSRRVFGIRGRVGTGMVVGQPSATDVHVGGRRLARGVQVWPVDVGLVKEQLYGWLHGKPPIEEGGSYPVGFCHFPQYPPDYFKGLTAETLERRVLRSGRVVHEWTKVRARNEPLDCRVYARAVAFLLGMDRWTREDWAEVRRVAAGAPPPEPTRGRPAGPERPRDERKRKDGSRWQRGRRRT